MQPATDLLPPGASPVIDGAPGEADAIQESKRQLRRDCRRRRQDCSRQARMILEWRGWRELISYLEEFPPRESADIALYIAINDEFPTAGLMAELRRAGRRLHIPSVDGHSSTMTFHPFPEDAKIVPGPLAAIPQPAEIAPAVDPGTLDAIFLPLLGFTDRGERLGQGQGCYDRCLASLAGVPDRPRLIGLAFEAQRLDSLPSEPHDVRLDGVFTERGLRLFGAA